MKKRYSNGSKNRFSDFLTVLLVVIIIAIIAMLTFFGYKVMNKHSIEVGAQNAYDRFQESVKNTVVENEVIEQPDENVVENENTSENVTTDLSNLINTNTTNVNESSNNSKPAQNSNSKKEYYAGYEIKGNINIPKTDCKYPILEKVTTKSLASSVAILDIVGADSMIGTIKELNVPGTNALILGHNFKNGLFFSNNYKLDIGDVIYITDQTGTKVTYTIYKKYYTDANDASFMERELDPEVREITLQTCNEDSTQRLIIWAKDK